MTPEEFRREVRHLEAQYYVCYPEDLDLPEDIIRRAAVQTVLRDSNHEDAPQVFRDAFGEPER